MVRTGAGDGMSARVLAPPPTDFRQAETDHGPRRARAHHGVAGSAMPPWDSKLSASPSAGPWPGTCDRSTAPKPSPGVIIVAINLIVAAVTLLMAGFVAVWTLSPSLRAWMESPKFRFIDRARRFPRAVREDRERR